jgi:hypothetical protein
MADLVVLVALVVFFAVAVAYVRVCDRVSAPEAEERR